MDVYVRTSCGRTDVTCSPRNMCMTGTVKLSDL